MSYYQYIINGIFLLAVGIFLMSQAHKAKTETTHKWVIIIGICFAIVGMGVGGVGIMGIS
ncbi:MULTISPECIES: hypothetical protein [Levilactobacillus]|uniref:Uncharacterized protein n=1 Tax=Levilactobacillus tongjiangensis TaxID=2486023 RepID=A0ABW1STP1_9LACO|nr:MULTISPECIES: hypothetical protein [Levilactobacillus]